MNADARITLREIASRLRGYPKYKNSKTGGRRELLTLLQQGEISAVFDFPSLARPTFPISREFWLDVPSGDFNDKLAWNTKKRNGRRQFLVNPAKFADRYVSWFGERHLRVHGEFSQDVSTELVSALRNIETKKECFILEVEWARFIRHAGLEHVAHENERSKSLGGARAFSSWESVLVELAAVMLSKKAQELSLEEGKSQMAAEAVTRAQKNGRKGERMPEIDTVVRKVTLILSKLDGQAT